MELSNPPESRIAGASRPRACPAVSVATVKELEKTIAGFQAILTDKDRKELQKLKTTSHDSQSIITFTAELDRLDKNRRGKSVASRLASFLQTIEQFTPIVDTYIQSNPDISALIWGSIKLTFMVLANFVPYFQSFVELLHGFGSLCKRFAEYQVILKESSRLKHSICRFHIAVVTCCQQIVLAIRRPLKNQFLKAITQSFQSELRTYVENIRSTAEEVQEDIQLVKTQCDRQEQKSQALERQEASDHRKWLKSWTASSRANTELLIVQQQRKERVYDLETFRRRLLEELSSYDFKSVFYNIRNQRHLGTAEWAFETPEFQEWIKPDGPQVLHVTGKNMEALEPQLASKISKCLSRAKERLFSRQLMTSLYLIAVKTIRKWYIVLDGLDESSDGQMLDLLKFFQGTLGNLQQNGQIKILLSCRESCTRTISHLFPEALCLKTGLYQTSADISGYVDGIIDEKISAGDLNGTDQSLIDDISTTIKAKEQGMFLWAFLTIEDVCSQTTADGIRQALQNIPADLPETINRALSRILRRRNEDIAKTIFSWTKAAVEPLTLSQLREALSIKMGQHTLHEEDLILGIERIPRWCESLVYVEETDDTVHFSHQSIQEFLLTPDFSQFQALHLDAQECDRMAGMICITYINLSNFQSAVCNTEHDTISPPTMKINPGAIAEQTMQTAIKGRAGVGVGRFTRHVLKPGNTSYASVSGESSLIVTVPRVQGIAAHPFLSYAPRNWVKHTAFIKSQDDSNFWSLFGKTIQEPPQHSETSPWFQGSYSDFLKDGTTFYSTDKHTDRQFLLQVLYRSISSQWARLCLAFVYANHNRYWGLSCRAFQLLATCELLPGPPTKLFHLFAANKNYDACSGQCLSFLSFKGRYMNHARLVQIVRTVIASGSSEFPALEKRNTATSCECSGEGENLLDDLKPDLCELLETGYHRRDASHIQAFIIIAKRSTVNPSRLAQNCRLGVREANVGGLRFSKLCEICQIAPDTLLNARSKSGMSLFDIFLRRLLSKAYANEETILARLQHFWEYDETENSILKSHLRTEIDNTIDFICYLQEATRGGQSPGRDVSQYVYPQGLFPLHKTSIIAIFRKIINPHTWTPSSASEVINAFFGESVWPGLEYTCEAIFRQAVWDNNSEIAAALVDVQPEGSSNTSAGDGFGFVREALRCNHCWARNQSEDRETKTVGSVGSGNVRQIGYLLCDKHVEIFSDPRNFSDVYQSRNQSLFCLGFPTRSLPTQEGMFEDDVSDLFGVHSC
ncbi:hypothetical protein FBEOM_9253 [Fusarium beomiforme]|uniref:NACHT domain-containing protein n=1 Tax=Fusarium beomiforme TaxID=44412 RepID=A0A9P5ADX7_9HYPO|nr:hypothetical protein FBEOM_9253 [Fusarium beomiforme]